jgi:lathosterol oxidase
MPAPPPLLSLCSLSSINPILMWLAMTFLALSIVMVLSGSLFSYYYIRPTFQKWRTKTNPEYPTPEAVRDEIVQMIKGLMVATVCPALSVFLAARGWSKAYCGVGEMGVGYLVASFFVLWVVNDLYEFAFHYIGHSVPFFWSHHKAHHRFYNPSPFAVIADEGFDQFFRSAPLLVLPLLAPVNIDLLFLQFGAFFYAYGVFLHLGHEVEAVSAHNGVLNVSYHHYYHHAKSLAMRPYHCGFFVQLWDRLAGSVPEGDCVCARCEDKAGRRSVERFRLVKIQDYSRLLDWRIWVGRK